MKKIFKPSNIITILAIVAATVLAIFNSSVLTWMIWLSTVLGLFSSQALSDAKIGSFVFEILSYAVYIYVCIKQAFFGEIILSCIIIVLHIITIFEWNKHLINKQVEVSNTNNLEIVVLIVISIVLGILYSLFLYKINSALPILNAIPTITYLLSCYFCYRRSILQFVCTIIYEISFMVLWIVQASWGEISGLIFLIGGIYEFIYAFISISKWKKLQKQQKK